MKSKDKMHMWKQAFQTTLKEDPIYSSLDEQMWKNVLKIIGNKPKKISFFNIWHIAAFISVLFLGWILWSYAKT